MWKRHTHFHFITSIQPFKTNHHTTTTILLPFFRDHPGEPVPEENFWTLRCNRRLTEADAQTIRLGDTPSGLTSAHLHHPQFFTGQMLFLLPNQQCQSTEGNYCIQIREKTLEFSSTVLRALFPYLTRLSEMVFTKILRSYKAKDSDTVLCSF